MQILFALLLGAIVLDGLVHPRVRQSLYLRSAAGTWLLVLLACVPFGFFLALSGNPIASAVLALALVGLFTMVSNAKRAMLGEPLVFSDLALIGAVFRHPQFYLSALTLLQKTALVLAMPVVAVLLWWMSRFDPRAHLLGLAVLMGSLVLLAVSVRLPPWARLVDQTDHHEDVARHGLLPSILLYWLCWRKSDDPDPLAPLPAQPEAGELVLVIQCESFADPVDLFDTSAHELPGLAAARSQAWQWGALHVSGFGAYTMRTEYGVLFGRSEEALGVRRFDPFLTALREASFALPARLSASGWRSLFVHPHDLRFYNRAEIMREGGFSELIGPEHFDPPGPDEGRYVTDKAIADKIIDLVRGSSDPTLVYAVTIENHGPWEVHAGSSNLIDGYMKLVRKGDAMLQTLISELAQIGRPSTLVFFGDHRPSIPGVVMPGPQRHTPYVIVRFDADGEVVKGHGGRADLTPAQLHHTVLDILSNGRAG